MTHKPERIADTVIAKVEELVAEFREKHPDAKDATLRVYAVTGAWKIEIQWMDESAIGSGIIPLANIDLTGD